jgi:anti-sigma B factor antagonist
VHTPAHSIGHEVEAPGVVRVWLAGEFDMDNSAELTASLLQAIDDPHVGRVIVDMRGTTFMDSSGVSALTNAQYAATQAGKTFEVANWTKDVRRVFELLELADALEGDREPPG